MGQSSPTHCIGFYLETLSTRLAEAGNDMPKICMAWEGFKAALKDEIM